MFEARLEQAEVLKKVLDAIKELVTDANFDCSDEGLKLQAMDNSHVALVSLQLDATGFQRYRCDRNMYVPGELEGTRKATRRVPADCDGSSSLQKIIKCASNDDIVTLRADESQDVLGLLFENGKHDRMGEYEMKLMDIDQEHLGIPETVYDAEISLPSAEFARIIRDLKELGESVKIEVSKDGVRFSCEGDIGTAAVTLKQSDGAKDGERMEQDDEEEEEEDAEEEEEEVAEEEPKEEEDAVVIDDEDEDESDVKPKKSKKKAVIVDDEDEEADEKPKVDADEEDEDEEEVVASKSSKGKKAAANGKDKSKKRKAPEANGKKGKKAKGDVDAAAARKVTINLSQAVNLTFSIKYLSNFAKSTPLSETVRLHMSNEVPLLVEYPFEGGHIRYYLAPKIADE
ncbi:BZ3500_MvSof-1268-A1-R1_Chr6-3g08918 [Microbotryum saponariae]|uniref:DNA sliding clamp PCNA n=1 Tax=Microbotryum saponariae TaxID=289078 RepID=A0A2X0KLX9_9BASI|nr:BZ3500_MvSof-1268-A1-R1_Chr6-3g08918 [Microbotryum saponariae]SDA07520.1 BZ3501_MvSof-1269-A2-R1_Chr6-2g08622 [Microbotryum saponariae]